MDRDGWVSSKPQGEYKVQCVVATAEFVGVLAALRSHSFHSNQKLSRMQKEGDAV